MSKSFKIEGGDLVIGAGRAFGQVQGKDKLFQDLKLWLLERIGTDPATPNYGSRLDGGVIGGVELESYIGQEATQDRISEVTLEISTLLERYQEGQLDKMRREVVEFGGNHTLTPNEILHKIDSIETAFSNGTLYVRVKCSTLSGDTFKLIIPAQV